MPQKIIVFLKTCSKLNKNKLLQDRHQNHIMDEIDKLLEQLALAVPPPIPDEVSDSETIIQQQAISEEWNIPLQTLARFYQRCLSQFAPIFQEYLEN